MNHLPTSRAGQAPAFRGVFTDRAEFDANSVRTSKGVRFPATMAQRKQRYEADDGPQKRKQPYRRDRKRDWLDDVFE